MKDNVFPDPVHACTHTSFSERNMGIVAACTGVMRGNFNRCARVKRRDEARGGEREFQEREAALEDEETEEQILVDTSDPVFQKNYTEIVLDNESQLILNLIKLKVDFIKILSDENYWTPLRKFFKKRIRR